VICKKYPSILLTATPLYPSPPHSLAGSATSDGGQRLSKDSQVKHGGNECYNCCCDSCRCHCCQSVASVAQFLVTHVVVCLRLTLVSVLKRFDTFSNCLVFLHSFRATTTILFFFRRTGVKVTLTAIIIYETVTLITMQG